MTFVLPFYADLCVGERSITGCECTGDIDLNSIIVPQEEHQMRSFSRSTSLRVEEIEQLFRRGVRCAKNAYATTDGSKLLLFCFTWRRCAD